MASVNATFLIRLIGSRIAIHHTEFATEQPTHSRGLLGPNFLDTSAD